jgi:hypothetical protein
VTSSEQRVSLAFFNILLCIAVSENQQSSCQFFAHFPAQTVGKRQYQPESSGSRPLTEDKQARARSVG